MYKYNYLMCFFRYLYMSNMGQKTLETYKIRENHLLEHVNVCECNKNMFVYYYQRTNCSLLHINYTFGPCAY